RKVAPPQLIEDTSGFIAVIGKRLDACLREKCHRLLITTPINVDGHNLEPVRTVLCLKLIQSGHFLATGRAPRSPKVEQGYLARKIRKRCLLAVLLEAEIGQ